MNATPLTTLAERKRAMQAEYDAGATVKEIAAKYYYTQQHVYRCVDIHWVPLPAEIGVGCAYCRELIGSGSRHVHEGRTQKVKTFLEAGFTCPSCGSTTATWSGGPVFCMSCGWER